MEEKIILRGGSIPGVDHQVKRFNNQDAFIKGSISLNGNEFQYGVVFDGCSLGGKKTSKNEFGSRALCVFMENAIRNLIAMEIPVMRIPDQLFLQTIGYLRGIVNWTIPGASNEMLWDFISKHLLSTVVGFIRTTHITLTFNAGDGVIIVGDDIIEIDQNNRPFYLAYMLMDPGYIKKNYGIVPTSFETKMYPSKDLKRIAVCTDGITNWCSSKEESREEKIKEFVSSIWENSPKAGGGLQWWLNKESNNKRFRDDATAVGLEIIPITKEGEVADAGTST